jgi:hypothetical protein
MLKLTDEGRQALTEIAGRFGVSLDAVEHILMAVLAGQTTQAQFNHPELGGMGQWSQGGMTMVSDMFNNSLKAKVDGLCSELAALARSTNLHLPVASSQSQSQYQGGGVSLFVPGGFSSGNWWPEELGHASSVGAQNDLRYAFFPATRRLAINVGGRITVYDTRDHQIGGFSQQQGGDQSLSFTSQYGLVRVSDLEVVQPGNVPVQEVARPAEPAPAIFTPSEPPIRAEPQPLQPAYAAAAASDEDIFAKIERLAALHAKGILTDEEFSTKKTELLSRL